MIRKIIRQKPHHLPREHYRGEIWVSYTSCVQDRHFLFTKHKIVDNFVSMLDWARKRNDCIVLLYCFMPDHIHVVFQGQSENADSYQAMLDFKQKCGYYRRVNRLTQRLQDGFYDRILRCDTELSEHLRYVAENPVRRGLVEHWQDYPFTNTLGIPMQTVIDIMFSL